MVRPNVVLGNSGARYWKHL